MRKKGEPERAIFLSRLPQTLPGGYARLYFGAEFCPWAMPSLIDCRAALEAARATGVAFSLALPVLAETELAKVRRLVAGLAEDFAAGDEIVISDLGLLNLLRETAPRIPRVLGRVLSGQKRGPQILDLELSPGQLHYFRQGRWYAAEAQRLLREWGIERIELDNLLQGIAPLPEPLRGTLHTPFAMVSSSRNCPFRPPAATGCNGECGELFTLASAQSRVLLYQGGNTQFYRSETVPPDLTSLGIDRLVFHPHLPR